MKNILHLLLLLILFQSCLRKKNDCIDISPIIISNKLQYNQFDKIKLKILYSERASYKWFLGVEPIGTNSSEITIAASKFLLGREINCESTIGNCVENTGIYLKVSPITVPSCTIQKNSITIDGKQMQISNMVFNSINNTINGKIKGPGASINDSIKIELFSNANLNDSISVYNIVNQNNYTKLVDNAKLNLVYGNLNFGSFNTGILVYRKTATGGSFSCCAMEQTAISIPSIKYNVLFSFDFTF